MPPVKPCALNSHCTLPHIIECKAVPDIHGYNHTRIQPAPCICPTAYIPPWGPRPNSDINATSAKGHGRNGSTSAATSHWHCVQGTLLTASCAYITAISPWKRYRHLKSALAMLPLPDSREWGDGCLPSADFGNMQAGSIESVQLFEAVPPLSRERQLPRAFPHL